MPSKAQSRIPGWLSPKGLGQSPGLDWWKNAAERCPLEKWQESQEDFGAVDGPHAPERISGHGGNRAIEFRRTNQEDQICQWP